MASLPEQLERLEASVTRAGGQVHWARDAAECNAILGGIAGKHGAREVIKVKSLATDEIGLNDALAAQGVEAIETDLAELINQLGHDTSSHILVPAIHRNRAEIKLLFEHTIARGQDLGWEITAIAEAARRHLREKFVGSGRDLGGELRHSRDRRDWRRGVRGQRANVPHVAACADHGDGDREGAAGVARPRGVPAAAAALGHRRADEPVHVAVDRRA